MIDYTACHTLIQMPVLQRDLRPREREVLKMMVRGMDYPEMAEQLGVNSLTAKFHVGNVLLKLGASNRTEAIDAAIRRHLVA